MSEDGYFGMGRLSFGGIGKVVMGAVETQIAAATLSPVASSHSASATRSNAPVRPARMTTKQNPSSAPLFKSSQNDPASAVASPGLAVASNLVKMVRGYAGSDTLNRAELAKSMENMSLQAPAYHGGLAVVIDSSSWAPFNADDFQYSWYRQYKQGSRATKIDDTDRMCPWYPPSADDIGMNICVKCEDIYNFGLVKMLSTKIDRADPQLVSSVEEAIEMNRLFIKKSVVSVRTLREKAVSASDTPRGNNDSSSGDLYARRGIKPSIGSMDEEEEGSEDIDVPASCEVTLDGILISERGEGSDSGLLITPSRRIKVMCLHPTSLQISVPLQIGSHSVPSALGEGSQPPLQKQPSVRWLGKEQGDLFEHLSSIIQDHHMIFEKYLRRHRKDQERRAAAISAPGDFAVFPSGLTKLLPTPTQNKMGQSSHQIPDSHISLVNNDLHACGLEDDDNGEIQIDSNDFPPLPAGVEEVGNTSILDSNFVTLTENGEHDSSNLSRELSEASLIALQREEMEKIFYKEVSISLSSHGDESSQDGSASGDEDFDGPFSAMRMPKELIIRILCQNRSIRDALALCIRALVSATPSLPTPILHPSSSPTVLLTEEQRKSLLPWHQLEDGVNSVPIVKLPIIHGSSSANSLDIISEETHRTEAEIAASMAAAENKISDLKSNRFEVVGISDSPSIEATEIQRLTQLCCEQKIIITNQTDELKMFSAELTEKDIEIAGLKKSLEEEKNKFVNDLNELQCDFNNLEAASAQKEIDLMLQMERQLSKVLEEEDKKMKYYRGSIESLNKELELASTQVSKLTAKLEAHNIIVSSSECKDVAAYSFGPDTTDPIKHQAIVAILLQNCSGGITVDMQVGHVFELTKLETGILQVLIDGWQKKADGSSNLFSNSDAGDNSMYEKVARILSKHDKAPPMAQATYAGGLASILDSIIFPEENIEAVVPSFDADEQINNDSSNAMRDSSLSVPLCSVDSYTVSGGIKERTKSNLSDDNIFVEISCALMDRLPPSEESLGSEDTLRHHSQILGSRSNSRDNTPHRLIGTTPPLIPSSCGSPKLLGIASPGQRYTPTCGRNVDSESRFSTNRLPLPFPVSDILPSNHDEINELRLQISELECELTRSEESRQCAADRLPELMKAYHDMKEEKDIAESNFDKANQRICSLLIEKDALIDELLNLKNNIEHLKVMLLTKTESLKENETVHSEEILKVCKENQELSVKYHSLLREHEEAVYETANNIKIQNYQHELIIVGLNEKVRKVNEALVIAEAASIDLTSQCGTDSKLLSEANVTIDRLQAEVDSLKQVALDADLKIKILEKECARNQKETMGIQKECTRLKETISTVQRNSEPVSKLKQDIAVLENRLAESEEKNNKFEYVISTSSNNWEIERKDLLSQLENAVERVNESENRIVALETELLVSSDSRHALTRQKGTTDEMNNQIKLLRQRLLETDQEAHAVQELLSAKQDENTKLSFEKDALEKEVETLRNTLEKRKARMEKLKVEAADCKKLTELSAAFDEERSRLKGIIDSLDKDRTELYGLRPQMLKLEAVNTDIKYERDLLTNQTKRQADELSFNALTIQSLEGQLNNLEQLQLQLRQEFETVSLFGEGLRSQTVILGEKYIGQQSANDKLKEDLHLAYTADPIRVKTLNFMLAKLQGDKNHWENKAKSLSRDLHRKLLAGTPLQRELGRISARLEEVEHERNAYKDAMVLACDSFNPQPEPSWLDYIS